MPRLPKKIGQKTPFGAEWDTMVDYLRSLRPMESAGSETTFTTAGVIRRVRPGGVASGGIAKPYKLKSVQADYVTARTWDGTNEGATDVYIAKPYRLRQSITQTGYTFTYSGSGNNIVRLKSDGSNSEYEVVVPIWLVDEIIYAIPAKTLVNDASEKPISLLLVADNKTWAKADPQP